MSVPKRIQIIHGNINKKLLNLQITIEMVIL